MKRLSSSAAAAVVSDGDNAKMKALFKSKPKTPADLVRQTRDLLMYADRTSDIRDSKREEKVEFYLFIYLFLCLFFRSCLICIEGL